MKHHIHIKTFKKPDLLNALLLSLHQHGYVTAKTIITVGDDNPGESLEVLTKFDFVQAYLTGDVHGIWANNNRGIKYFLEDCDADALMILDNDIEFTKSGMLETLEQSWKADRQEHITGFARGLDGIDGLQVVFPFVVESAFLKWHPGCHGVMFWQTRRIVETVGYQLEYKYFYGAEHAEYTHRCLKAQRNSNIGLYPVLKQCHDFFKLNPADHKEYEFDIAQVMEKNQNQMQERDTQTLSGMNLKEHHHHLGKELKVKPGDNFTAEQVKDLLATVKYER